MVLLEIPAIHLSTSLKTLQDTALNRPKMKRLGNAFFSYPFYNHFSR